MTKEFLEAIKEDLPELKIFNNVETKDVSQLHYKKIGNKKFGIPDAVC